MGWISIAITVVGYIIKYGPKLWKLGLAAYEMVEEMKREWRKTHPKKPEKEIKEMADNSFDELIVRESARRMSSVPAPVTRTQLRRDVWSSKKENTEKVRRGKTAGRGG